MNRAEQLKKLGCEYNVCDILIIGGGATGLGVVVDASLRGYKTVLLEKSDFCKSTSSKSTKLIHGGLRYLQHGSLSLVRTALQERAYVLQNAPHIAQKQEFVVPLYGLWQLIYYSLGIKLYDWLAGSYTLGKGKFYSKKGMKKRFPGINEQGLSGGLSYYDGQFDDSRLGISLAETAVQNQAIVLNYMEVIGIETADLVYKITAVDRQTNKTYTLVTRVLVNAGGVFADKVLKLSGVTGSEALTLSKGTHLVLSTDKVKVKEALVIPKTKDGRILFVIPWNGVVIVGTTDQKANRATLEPLPSKSEIDFILAGINAYFSTKIYTEDIISVFSGLRPLISSKSSGDQTHKISREHRISVSKSGILTVVGGKWTTYRKMAEDILHTAIQLGKIPYRPCRTKHYPLAGFLPFFNINRASFDVYGSLGKYVQNLVDEDPSLGLKIHEQLPYISAEVVWAVRNEAALHVEDVLARRLRAVLINPRASMAAAPVVAKLMARELGLDAEWEKNEVQAYNNFASNYLVENIL